MGSNRNLLWINHFAASPGDGGGTRHFEIGRELVKRGWRVTIAASDFNLHSRQYTRRQGPDDRRDISETIDGVEFRWLWTAPYNRNDWRRARNWLTFARGALRLGATLSPSIVIGSSPHLFAALAGERLSARRRIPFVLEVRDLWPESLVAAGGRRGPAYHVFAVLAAYLYKRANRIVVLARGSADHIVRRGIPAGRLAYVPNGVDLEAFTTIDSERPMSRTGGPLTFIYAGAHGPANGLDTVLEAAALLKDDPRIHFLLVGDGPAKAGLVATAAQLGLRNVEFRAPVPKSAMPELLAMADAGLMVLRDSPLFAYGVSPNKLFDYMGAGLPVVCNVPGDTARMLNEAASGEQATDASADALADAVCRLANRLPHDRPALASAARAWVAREHTRPTLADRLDGVLSAAIEGS